jgi:hypothetical protein
MKWFGRLFGVVIALVGVEQAMAKARLTDPLKIARECKNEPSCSAREFGQVDSALSSASNRRPPSCHPHV